MALCPIHPESRPSFAISEKKDSHPWRCFVCGSGTIFELFRRVHDIPFGKAYKLVEQYGNAGTSEKHYLLDLPEHPSRRTVENPDSKPTNILRAYPFKKEAKDYLLKRGCSEKNRVITEERVGWDWRNQAIVYQWWWEGSLVGLSFRGMDGFKRKDVKQSLYPYSPLDEVGSEVILCEGEMDAVRISEVNPSVIALGSNKVTDPVLSKLYDRGAKSLVFLFDFDEGGTAGTVDGYDAAIEFGGFTVYVCRRPQRCVQEGWNDPADMPRWMIRKILRDKVLAERALFRVH